MGGETCGESEYCLCDATLKDLVDYHWTHLNEDYHTGVISRWKSNNCYNEIVARLGYRLVMRDLFYSKDFAAGKPCSVTLRFYNTGFAAESPQRHARMGRSRRQEQRVQPRRGPSQLAPRLARCKRQLYPHKCKRHAVSLFERSPASRTSRIQHSSRQRGRI